jgi:hypothetical protein
MHGATAAWDNIGSQPGSAEVATIYRWFEVRSAGIYAATSSLAWHVHLSSPMIRRRRSPTPHDFSPPGGPDRLQKLIENWKQGFEAKHASRRGLATECNLTHDLPVTGIASFHNQGEELVAHGGPRLDACRAIDGSCRA